MQVKVENWLPFIILFLTNLVTAYGTIQVLKAEISFLNKTVDRHEIELREIKKEQSAVHRGT